MEQGSPEWHAARAGRVTASLVGAILGNSPYMTRDEALRAHVRGILGLPSEFTGNAATKWGNANEDTARACYELDSSHDVKQIGFVIHQDEDWAGCSPDGFVSDKGGVEIKCPYSLRQEKKPVFKSLDDQPGYMDQIQFTLWVTRRDWWHFYQWAPHGSAGPVVVKPDQDWRDTNLPILRQFHAEALDEARERPSLYQEPLRVTVDTPEAAKAMEEWDDIKEQADLLEKRKKALLGEITAMTGDRDAIVAGRLVTRVKREGAVSYTKVVKEHLPKLDLEPYRGAASEYWKVT